MRSKHSFFNCCASAQPAEAHTNALRANTLAQVITTPFTNFSPRVQIPKKLIQLIICLVTFFKETTPVEKSQHGILAVIASIQLILGSILFFQDMLCPNDSDRGLCQGNFYLELLYTAILSVSWTTAEVITSMNASRDRHDEPAPNTNPDSNQSPIAPILTPDKTTISSTTATTTTSPVPTPEGDGLQEITISI